MSDRQRGCEGMWPFQQKRRCKNKEGGGERLRGPFAEVREDVVKYGTAYSREQRQEAVGVLGRRDVVGINLVL